MKITSRKSFGKKRSYFRALRSCSGLEARRSDRDIQGA